MNILIVHPFRNENSGIFSIMSIGMITTANFLISEGHRVTGVNLPLQYALGESGDINVYIKRYKPDIVMISCHWYEFYNGAMEIAKETKKNYPTVMVAAAGMSASFFSEQLKGSGLFDVIIKDGADYLCQICSDLLHHTSSYKTPEHSLPNENFSDIRFLLNHDKYYQVDISGFNKNNIRNYWLCLGRGCIYNCGYCGGSRTAHSRFYSRVGFCARKWEEVEKDIKYLFETEVEQLSFTHDLEMVEYGTQILRLFSSTEKKIYYESFQLPASDFLDNICTFLPNRCHIAISAISGNEKNRRNEGKAFTNQQLLQILSTYSAHIHFSVYFTLNIENESLEEFQETAALLDKLLQYRDVECFCMPHFQNEIGSSKWVQNGTSIEKSIDILKDYLSYPDKTNYFLTNEPRIIPKILIWNKTVEKANGGTEND